MTERLLSANAETRSVSQSEWLVMKVVGGYGMCVGGVSCLK